MFINIMSEPPTKGGSWIDDAECKNHDSTMWILSEDPKGRALNKSNFEKAEIICSTCPVITECWQAATYVDKLVTMRGGAWPEEYRAPGVKHKYPQGRKETGKRRKLVCRGGHDTSDPASRNASGQCRQCKREQEKLRKRERSGKVDSTEKATA